MFSDTILNWYACHKRDLPWRNISDPYKIWVSEIILQQTRIAQGHAYYVRFLKAFPSVRALALAEEDEVMRQWQGLGYYSRARNMQIAAKQVMEGGGEFPTTYEGVRALKGVGDYTAAAICSFAYHMPYAVVDGNVYRVLSRYFDVTVPIDTAKGQKYFAHLAQSLLPAHDSHDYNQGIMDFGAIQCVPLNPNCEVCPLAESCAALAHGHIDHLPIRTHKVKVRNRFFACVKVVTPDGVWLRKRTNNDIWQGLYEYVLMEFSKTPRMPQVVECLSTSFQVPQGGTWTMVKKNVRHLLTHQMLKADFYELRFNKSIPINPSYIVVKEECLADYAMPQLLQNAY